MPDSFSPEERSRIMRAVRGKDTRLEVKVRSALWRLGVRFRKNVESLPGKPDIAFTKRRVAVFVDSCFWHGCSLHLRRPASNQEYWEAKIERNRRRDVEVGAAYRQMGWTVVRLWEHEVKEDLEACLRRIIGAVRPQTDPSDPDAAVPPNG